MSDIKPGDLVYLHGSTQSYAAKYLGTIRTVRRICPVHFGCFDLDPPTLDKDGYEFSWEPEHLKKIDPLSEPEITEHNEELKV